LRMRRTEYHHHRRKEQGRFQPHVARTTPTSGGSCRTLRFAVTD
jgi:hypothetical protein